MALGSLALIGTEFMPRLDEGSLLIETRKLPSVSLTESVVISTQIKTIILEFPEVEGVVTKIGRPDLATEAMGIYQGDVYVNLKPRKEWTTADTKEDLIDTMAARLAKFPGVAFSFTQPMAMRLDEVVSGVKADVTVKVFGPDENVLSRIADQVLRAIVGIEGAADVQEEVFSGAAEWQIRVDRAELSRYGLNVSNVRDVVETAVADGLQRSWKDRSASLWRYTCRSGSRLTVILSSPWSSRRLEENSCRCHRSLRSNWSAAPRSSTARMDSGAS